MAIILKGTRIGVNVLCGVVAGVPSRVAQRSGFLLEDADTTVDSGAANCQVYLRPGDIGPDGSVITYEQGCDFFFPKVPRVASLVPDAHNEIPICAYSPTSGVYDAPA